MDLILLILGLALAGAVLLGPLVLSLAAFIRSQRIGELTRRMQRLEVMVSELRQSRVDLKETATAEARILAPGIPTRAEPSEKPSDRVEEAPILNAVPRPLPRQMPGPAWAAFDWEWFIGRRALGWAAVLLVVLATGFFLRYAIENNWIGPIGRVSLAAVAGLALIVAGWRYDARPGWRVFAQMLSGAGVVLLYLAAYSAFGFYHLLPQRSGGVFLMIIVAETMALAALYDAPALGLAAVLGGLLTPVLMRSETDQYSAFFLYLALFDTGIALLALGRSWPAVTTLALVGTQGLFWSWYQENDHPEKRWAELALQAIVFGLFLVQVLAAYLLRGRVTRWEDLTRWLLNAFFGFLAFYVLMNPDQEVWSGTMALALAALYAAIARQLLVTRTRDPRLYLAALAIAAGFVAVSFAVQANARWIALGWAAEAAVLWWFGLRVRLASLRALAAVLALMATVRVVCVDTLAWADGGIAAWPVLNAYALPAIGASAFLLAALAAARGREQVLSRDERTLCAVAQVAWLAQLWLVMSVDLYEYCHHVRGSPAGGDDRLAQMVLSILWAVFATVVLAIGFRRHQSRLRWTALGLFGLTIAKVLLFDMSGLDEVFRILAFLVLAIALGGAARVYQRIRPEREKTATVEI